MIMHMCICRYRPVSYTHLDVYKRVGIGNAISTSFLFICLLYTSRCV
ncbi:hypothetical protein AZZ60_000584 [Escherichia coli]|nr:hypothetical protein AZZ60_000584 [Escherichia coli]